MNFTSIRYFAFEEDGSWFNKDKWSVFQESTLVASETKQKKNVKRLFNPPVWLFSDYCQIPGVFSPLG